MESKIFLLNQSYKIDLYPESLELDFVRGLQNFTPSNSSKKEQAIIPLLLPPIIALSLMEGNLLTFKWMERVPIRVEICVIQRNEPKRILSSITSFNFSEITTTLTSNGCLESNNKTSLHVSLLNSKGYTEAVPILTGYELRAIILLGNNILTTNGVLVPLGFDAVNLLIRNLDY